MLTKLIKKIWPKYCTLCREPTTREPSICIDCEESLPWNVNPCKQCGMPLDDAHNSPIKICGQCITTSPPYTTTIAPFHYHDPINKFITRLKFHQQLYSAKLLGELLTNYILKHRSISEYPEIILPVPLHKKRLKQRGFNQALEIARPVSKVLNIPIDYTMCQRVKNTVAQSSLPAKERAYNLKRAFVMVEKPVVKHVAIIDDVMTTGNTILEVSKVLSRAGVEVIEVWCCARRG